MKTYVGRALLAVLVCTAFVIAGPEWREDEDGGEDAGNTPGTAQGTVGTGAVAGLSGRLQALAPTSLGGGGQPDFDDVYIVCIDDPENFRATTADSGGFSEFDSRLYLFSLDGFGIVGNNTPTTVISLDSAGGGFDGAILDSQATDGTGSEVLTSGLYLLAITVAPRTPLGPSGESVFFFETPDEISGPDGPDGDEPLIEWSTAFGACCAQDGTCELETEEDCGDVGGSYQGDESTCANVSCPVLIGACCMDDGSCFDADEDTCGHIGGTYQGDGEVCAQVLCPQPSNDLCSNAFSIDLGDTPFDTTQATTDGTADCKGFDALNDIWYRFTATVTGQLEVEVCASDFNSVAFVYAGCGCPVGPGSLLACGINCSASVFVDAGQCYTIRVGGYDTFVGYTGGGGGSDGTGTLSLSLTAVGACDIGKYGCFITTEADCNDQEGYYLGDGSVCPSFGFGNGAPASSPPLSATSAPAPRQVPTAAYPDGTPVAEALGGDTPEADGEYTIMVSGVCFANEVPTGGCEFPDGTCVETTEFACVQNGNGTWVEGESCDEVPPTVTCSVTILVVQTLDGNGPVRRVEFAAEDESGLPVTVTGTIVTDCGTIEVESGDNVFLPCPDDGWFDDDEGDPTGGGPCFSYIGSVLVVNALAATLEVTATDAAGNSAECVTELCVPADEGFVDDD